MDKIEFLDLLRKSGFNAEMLEGIPTVLSHDLVADIPKVENIFDNCSYNESYGLKKI